MSANVFTAPPDRGAGNTSPLPLVALWRTRSTSSASQSRYSRCGSRFFVRRPGCRHSAVSRSRCDHRVAQLRPGGKASRSESGLGHARLGSCSLSAACHSRANSADVR